MKKTFFLFLFAFLGMKMFATALPDEGMWLPMFIKNYNYAEMQKLGLKLTPEQLYDINSNSLKDAIVQLGGGFCTGEMVSADGLMFTNHHCGYQFIAEHSTAEHDDLKNGCWAMTREEELPNPGFTVNFLVRMEDVTAAVLDSVKPGMKESRRSEIIEKAIAKLKKNNSEKGKYTVTVKPFYEGNEYYMFVYITYKDVRLAGAPPSAIGKFGGDTDNWMWPRHTGDFSIFRIYTAPDGSPAEYSKDNVPLHPKHFLPVSLKGVELGDYAMIWGYPGTTERFMTSSEVKNTINTDNPALVEACNYILPVIRDNMNASDKVRLGYADHYAGLSNMWKNKQGETESLIKLKVAEKKAAQEKTLTEWINKDKNRQARYGHVLTTIDSLCTHIDATAMRSFWYANIALMASKTSIMSLRLQGIKPTKDQKSFENDKKEKLIENYRKLAEGTDPVTEQGVLEAALKLWQTLPEESRPNNLIAYMNKTFKGDEKAFASAMVHKSIYGSEANFKKFLDKPSLKIYENDPLVRYFQAVFAILLKSQGIYGSFSAEVSTARHDYLAALKEMNADTPMYPDANSTMRVTYGSVVDYYPADGVHYTFQTTGKGILEKEKPGDPEFDVPAKLKQLIENRDFGDYALKNGELPVCFLSNNDITGGNSGSPVMNANGELIGLAFDGNWEALSSDIVFNTKLQRCINVDVRYVLFIIDKYAGAGHLLKEMTIVR
ncbi:MAG: S46 family peptidase [Bacteroidales bacterium]|jgi:hypothetical protein|nr:S46 family peptidase [Bacteroidales bacterium]